MGLILTAARPCLAKFDVCRRQIVAVEQLGDFGERGQRFAFCTAVVDSLGTLCGALFGSRNGSAPGTGRSRQCAVGMSGDRKCRETEDGASHATSTKSASNHVFVFVEQHLRQSLIVLSGTVHTAARTHPSWGKDAPIQRAVQTADRIQG